MKIEVHSFKTKVAQRIVFLFLLCALLPASTLGALGYWQVRSELQAQRSDRLDARLSGAVQGLIERIQSIQAEQGLLAQRILLDASGVAADDLHRVTDITLVIGADTSRIIGTLASLPSASDEVLASLQTGEAVLTTLPRSRPDHLDILMAVPLDPGDASRGTMWVRA